MPTKKKPAKAVPVTDELTATPTPEQEELWRNAAKEAPVAPLRAMNTPEEVIQREYGHCGSSIPDLLKGILRELVIMRCT